MPETKHTHTNRASVFFSALQADTLSSLLFAKCSDKPPWKRQFSLGSLNDFHNLFKQLFRVSPRNQQLMRKVSGFQHLRLGAPLALQIYQELNVTRRYFYSPVALNGGTNRGTKLSSHLLVLCLLCYSIYITRNSTTLRVLQAVMT